MYRYTFLKFLNFFTMNRIFFFFSLSILFVSCVKEGADIEYSYYSKEDYAEISKHVDLPPLPYDYALKTPSYVANAFFAVPPDNAAVTLGRVLFYDKNLSKDRKISCASCHDQKLGFADSKAFSDGPNGKVTTRNSLALGSVLNFSVYYGDERYGRVPFFWDNSATTVQEQSSRTLNNPNEMDMKMSEVVARVKENKFYEPLFEKAFKYNNEINEQTVLDAISSFVNSIPAYNTKWDAELENHFKRTGSTFDLVKSKFSGYTDLENEGKTLYLSKCATCHGETIGSPTQMRANNGLAMTYSDEGIGGKTGVSSEKSLFKVPTLRNILLSAPYMHDGSLATIDDVLNHYSNNIQNHANLSSLLKSSGKPVKMNFSDNDKKALKAFFETLTDYQLMDDKRFSDPFKK
jgi:cytochrome c peroxidase